MNPEVKKYVDFLRDSADLLSAKINPLLPRNYEKVELLFFIDFVMCDLMQSINLPLGLYILVVNKYKMGHLLMGTISIAPNNEDDRVKFLNEKSVLQSSRMNEYKNNTPLMIGLAKNDDKYIRNVIFLATEFICTDNKDQIQFREKLFSVIKEHVLIHIDTLLILNGSKEISEFVYFMIDQEKSIYRMIRNKIVAEQNELELYYYCYYLVRSYYKNIYIVDKIVLSDYSYLSLQNIIKTVNGYPTETEVFNNQIEKYKYYNSGWVAAETEHEIFENTDKIAMFFCNASNNIYGSNQYFSELSCLYLEIIQIFSNGAQDYHKTSIKSARKIRLSLFEKIKSVFDR